MTSSSGEIVQKTVRIGGASGFWGDSMVGPCQLIQAKQLDYLVFDYLAETTMAILASARTKNPQMGYATDFVEVAMKSIIHEVKTRGIKVISNAGGINPEGCASALRSLAKTEGIELRVSVVLGDDVSGLMPSLRDMGVVDMFTGEPLPEQALTANAYLGAVPICSALAAGAEVVITGRCVDSAVTLGALMYEFGWASEDYDLLASGSLAGHIIECGCQASGGLHTDWEDIPDWANIGYPIIECNIDGSFVVTKLDGTGGKILRANVAEQLLYEIGDPAQYLLPDVTCDFRYVEIEQQSENRVYVSPARGTAPPTSYKVSATQLKGYRCVGTLFIIGIDAEKKAIRTGRSIIDRTNDLLRQRGQAPFTASNIEVVGAETSYGPHSRTRNVREVMMRIVVSHDDKSALQLFSREVAPAGTSWAPGTTGPGGGRPTVSPLIKPFSFTLMKSCVAVSFTLDGTLHPVAVPLTGKPTKPAETVLPIEFTTNGERLETVRLIDLAWARSGDKGNISNVGVIARRPEWISALWTLVTPERILDYLGHLVTGNVERFYLPGTASLNILLHEALEGGGPSSMRMDPLGKGMGQMLLEMTLEVPESMAQVARMSKRFTTSDPE